MPDLQTRLDASLEFLDCLQFVLLRLKLIVASFDTLLDRHQWIRLWIACVLLFWTINIDVFQAYFCVAGVLGSELVQLLILVIRDHWVDCGSLVGVDLGINRV